MNPLKTTRLEVQPDDFFRHCGNVFIKRMYLEKRGHACIGHSHKHDHISLLAHGSVLVKSEAADRAFKAPAFIDVPAGAHHQFVALEDETVLFCVHDTHGLYPDDLGEPYNMPHLSGKVG